jgi:phosphatidate cytidylyltransferase|tara:strand:+ start:1291 stop:1971 length:681 start_codon:yes stop_codon:yes gene_type:complete
MNSELIKRIITSFGLIVLLSLAFFYTYILIISLIILSVISWIEFTALISKIYKKKNIKVNFFRLIIKATSLIYLILFSSLIFNGVAHANPVFKIYILYLFAICICSDVGGFVFGKIFKGKKLTKISPNKTVSGSIGSFMLSLILVPIFYIFFKNSIYFFNLIFISIIVSLFCQLGDLFISYLKRRAKVKDTSNILPGHGGLLDRIDGMLFAIPAGIVTWEFLIKSL